MGRGHFVVPWTDEQRWWLSFGLMWRDIGACCPCVLATARQAVLDEREACARVADDVDRRPKMRDGSPNDAKKIAIEIRARPLVHS